MSNPPQLRCPNGLNLSNACGSHGGTATGRYAGDGGAVRGGARILVCGRLTGSAGERLRPNL